MNTEIPFFILSRYDEDASWVLDYTDNYIILNKGAPVEGGFKSINLPNIGGNQFDISWFIWQNYDNLPDIMIFTQAFPWDHCNRDKFDSLIKNKFLTPLESYEHLENTYAHRIDESGGYNEINNSWYIGAHNSTYNISCRYSSYDEFMHKYFEDYKRQEYIRFSPGSQYLVTKEDVMKYPMNFWKLLSLELPEKSMTEAHIVERALLYILSGKYKLREEEKT
jgi:hypothetical protein